jgi:hypothetical protein
MAAAMNRAMGMATRVAGNKEGKGNGGKSNDTGNMAVADKQQQQGQW